MLLKGRTICQQLPYELNSKELICTILQKGHGHDTDEWRDYDVPFERLEKVYVPDEDSLEQKINIFHGQLSRGGSTPEMFG